MLGEIIEILSSDDEDQYPNNVNNHIPMNVNDSIGRILKCPFGPNCGFISPSFEIYLDHLSQLHSNNDKYICLYCQGNNNVLNVTSLYLGQLKPHVEVLHKDIVNFKPEIVEQPKTKPISRNLPVIQRVPVEKQALISLGCPILTCHLNKTNSLTNLNISRHITAFHPACLFKCSLCPPNTSLYADGAMNLDQVKSHVDRVHTGNFLTIIDGQNLQNDISPNCLSMSPRQLMNSTVLQVPISCPISTCKYHTPECAVHSARVSYECSDKDRCIYDRPKDFFNHLVVAHSSDSSFLCKFCYDIQPNINLSTRPNILFNHMLQAHGGCFKGVTYLKKSVKYSNYTNPVPTPPEVPIQTADIMMNRSSSVVYEESQASDPKSHHRPSEACGHTCFVPGCPITRTFSNVESLLVHICTRHSTSRFDCKLCSFLSREKPLIPCELKLHLDSCHGGQISSISSIVVSCFVSKCSHRGSIQSHEQLMNHIGYYHASIKFSCKLCPPNDNMMSTIDMKSHVYYKHSGFLNYIYELDRSENEDNDSDLEITEEIIPVKKNIDCSKCSKSFTRIEDYYNHVAETHHKLQFLCNSCRQLFKTLDEMRLHRQEKHPQELTYSCNHCHSFTAPELKQLEQHQVSCRQECIYRCTTCGFTSHEENSYKTHLSSESHRRVMARKKANKYVKAAHNQIMKKGSKPDIMVDKFTGQIFVGGQPLAPARNLSYKPPKRVR